MYRNISNSILHSISYILSNTKVSLNIYIILENERRRRRRECNNQIWIPPLGEEVENSGVPRRKRVIGRRLKRMCVTDDCYRGVRLIVSFFSLSSSLFLIHKKIMYPACLPLSRTGPGSRGETWRKVAGQVFQQTFRFSGSSSRQTDTLDPVCSAHDCRETQFLCRLLCRSHAPWTRGEPVWCKVWLINLSWKFYRVQYFPII